MENTTKNDVNQGFWKLSAGVVFLHGKTTLCDFYWIFPAVNPPSDWGTAYLSIFDGPFSQALQEDPNQWAISPISWDVEE